MADHIGERNTGRHALETAPRAAAVSACPEHEKLRAVADQTQAIGEFIEWLESRGIFLARYIEGSQIPRHVHGFRDLLAEWAGIDQDKLETEKRQMLAALQDGGT